MDIPRNGVIWAAFLAGDDEAFEMSSYLHEEWSKLESGRDILVMRSYEIYYAILMLHDGMLPMAAQQRLAQHLLEASEEISKKKYCVESLGIKPPPAGRQSDKQKKGQILFSVHQLINGGIPPMEAYRRVAEEEHKSVDTIRRMYERAKKRHRND